MSLITLFIAPKPFTNPHIATIQWNALRSWQELGAEVEILLIGEEAGVPEAARELNIRLISEIARNKEGTPLLSALFNTAREAGNSPLIGYVNADIILFEDFLETARKASQMLDQFLLVGQRWDLDLRERLDFSSGWQARLQADLKERGRLHPRGGSDYFIYPRSVFTRIPDFAIGRAGWDNWMFYKARREGWRLVDCTNAIRIIHQDHDYSHLPNNQPHYRLPETAENVRLAGGKRAIFNLLDCDAQMEQGQIRPAPMTWEKLWREVEIFPLIRLRSTWLAQVFFAIFHPIRAYRELRTWLARRKG